MNIELCSMSDESSDENDKGIALYYGLCSSLNVLAASPMREKSQTIIRLKSLDIMNRM